LGYPKLATAALNACLEVAAYPSLRSRNEDVDQSLGALLPIRTGCYVGDANKRSKQIDCIKVFPYVAAFDGAFDQSPNSIPDLGVRSFERCFRPVDCKRFAAIKKDFCKRRQSPLNIKRRATLLTSSNFCKTGAAEMPPRSPLHMNY
jgi:hypothetical protein